MVRRSQQRPQRDRTPAQKTRRPKRIATLTVRHHDDGWRLLVDDLPTPAWTVSTKRRAVRAAREAAQDLHARLVIETSSGSIHQTHDYTQENA